MLHGNEWKKNKLIFNFTILIIQGNSGAFSLTLLSLSLSPTQHTAMHQHFHLQQQINFIAHDLLIYEQISPQNPQSSKHQNIHKHLIASDLKCFCLFSLTHSFIHSCIEWIFRSAGLHWKRKKIFIRCIIEWTCEDNGHCFMHLWKSPHCLLLLTVELNRERVRSSLLVVARESIKSA